MIKEETVYVVRTCKQNMSSYNGFIWPKKGPVSCPDWKNDDRCGFGLHGTYADSASMSKGSSYFSLNGLDNWLIVEVEKKSIVNLGDKIKFPKGVVKFSGVFARAMRWLNKHADAEIDLEELGRKLKVPNLAADRILEEKLKNELAAHCADFIDELKPIFADKSYRYYKKLLRNDKRKLTLRQAKNIAGYMEKSHPVLVLILWSYVQCNCENMLTLHHQAAHVITSSVVGKATKYHTKEMYDLSEKFHKQHYLPEKYRSYGLDDDVKWARKYVQSLIGI